MPQSVHTVRMLVLALSLVPAVQGRAQAVPRIPLTAGLVLVATFQTGETGQVDREDVITVDQVRADGVRYRWNLTDANGSGAERRTFTRFVRAEDLAAAPRINLVFSSRDPETAPGSTAFSLSTAALKELRSAGETHLSYAETEDALGGLLDNLAGRPSAGAGARRIGIGEVGTRVYYRGTLTLTSREVAGVPLLLNGRRTVVPALHARGSFTRGDRRVELELDVVPDSAHPLLLRISRQHAIWQLLRIDQPGMTSAASVEADLARACRAELPGIYFASGGAGLLPESGAALRTVADLIARHSTWTMSVEGHTDGVGSAAENQALSSRRAVAVRDALISAYGVPGGRLSVRGLGATRPRESNVTPEGRARNRRVELVRSCAAQ